MTEFIYYTDSEDPAGFGSKLLKSIKESIGIEAREAHKVQVDLNIFKSKGIWKWVGIFTNNFRDDDIRPEIFSADSHRRYVDKVDTKEKDLPELWLFHEEAWKIGKASFVAVDEHEDDIVFVVVGGDIDADKYNVAEKLAQSRYPLKMSHGVPASEIVRNKEDDSIFDDYWSMEVSIVPAGLEANPLTAFGVIGDSNMIAQHKREEMKAALGVDDSLLDGLEAVNAQVAAEEKERREHKSKTQEVEKEVEVEETVLPDAAAEEIVGITDDAPQVDTVVEDTVVEELVVEEVAEEIEEGPSMADLVGALAGIGKSLDLIVTRLESTEKTVADLTEKAEVKEVEEKAAQAEPIPAPEAPVALSIFDSLKSSIIGKNAAIVKDTDDGLDKQPEEAEAEIKSRTGSALVDGLIAGSVSR